MGVGMLRVSPLPVLGLVAGAAVCESRRTDPPPPSAEYDDGSCNAHRAHGTVSEARSGGADRRPPSVVVTGTRVGGPRALMWWSDARTARENSGDHLCVVCQKRGVVCFDTERVVSNRAEFLAGKK